jgi:hypothetical protein
MPESLSRKAGHPIPISMVASMVKLGNNCNNAGGVEEQEF